MDPNELAERLRDDAAFRERALREPAAIATAFGLSEATVAAAAAVVHAADGSERTGRTAQAALFALLTAVR